MRSRSHPRQTRRIGAGRPHPGFRRFPQVLEAGAFHFPHSGQRQFVDFKDKIYP
jgi:hypothetical protein